MRVPVVVLTGKEYLGRVERERNKMLISPFCLTHKIIYGLFSSLYFDITGLHIAIDSVKHLYSHSDNISRTKGIYFSVWLALNVPFTTQQCSSVYRPRK